MKITEYSLNKKTFAYVLTLLLILGGIWAYDGLGRLEFPAFTIKTAVVTTSYPGASAEEVEQEVTDLLETSIQQLSQVDEIRSISRTGLSIIYVDIKEELNNATMPQVWDELRRKVSDVQIRLPKGAAPSMVNDDFGDEYGVFFAVYGDGFSYRELKDYVDYMRRELLLVQDVASVEIFGAQTETIFIEISRERAAEFGLCIQDAINTLNNQGIVSDAGRVKVGDDYVRLNPTGGLGTLEDLKNLLVRCGQGYEEIRLGDIAKIYRDYQDPPTSLMRYNGKPALGIGIATTADGNVVTMGEAVKKRITEIEKQAPLGLEMGIIAYQSDTVTKAVKGFILNLVEAVAIVIAILLLTMGAASGILMGVILLLTIFATFICMKLMGISLQIISLGALILSLGMLVDNAIVVTEGVLVRVKKGIPRREAVLETCSQTAWPLLGATLVAILAFAAIGTSKNNTGEFLGSLFQVMALSLGISWILALTLTPLFAEQFLPSAKKYSTSNDPYSGPVFQSYKKFLNACLQKKILCVGVLLLVLFLAIFGLTKVESSFFPKSNRPQFMVDYFRPEGTHISRTSQDLIVLESRIAELDGVEATTTFVGRGGLRFLLTYEPEMPNSSYGQVLVTVSDYHQIPQIIPKVRDILETRFIDAEYKIKQFEFGPATGSKIEVRFIGENPDVLRKLSDKARAIMAQNPNAGVIRDDWRQRVRTLEPVVSEIAARQTGITRAGVAQALAGTFSGQTVGVFREEDKLIPIVFRAPEDQRNEPEQIHNVQVMAPAAGKALPIGQIVTDVRSTWEDPIIRRLNRKRTLTVMCDQKKGNASPLFEALRPEMEAMELPPGYELEWGGEYEDSGDAQRSLFRMVPAFFLFMVLIILWMFNSIRQTIIIFLCIPLSLIGMTGAFLISGKSFDFNCLLGFLGLSGMLIKNAVVLIEQICIDSKLGKDLFSAILDASVSRFRPVCMASFTTVLGMMPLVVDPFFGSMSLTIIGGLTFGTVLTLVVVPVFYAIFYRARPATVS